MPTRRQFTAASAAFAKWRLASSTITSSYFPAASAHFGPERHVVVSSVYRTADCSRFTGTGCRCSCNCWCCYVTSCILISRAGFLSLSRSVSYCLSLCMSVPWPSADACCPVRNTNSRLCSTQSRLYRGNYFVVKLAAIARHRCVMGTFMPYHCELTLPELPFSPFHSQSAILSRFYNSMAVTEMYKCLKIFRGIGKW